MDSFIVKSGSAVGEGKRGRRGGGGVVEWKNGTSERLWAWGEFAKGPLEAAWEMQAVWCCSWKGFPCWE